MPLIATQHIISALGIDSDSALEDLNDELESLPQVRIISIAMRGVPFRVMGQTSEGVQLIAVVEEA